MKFNVLIDEVKAAMLFASTDESRYVLNSVSFQLRPDAQPIMVATDGRRLAVIETESAQEEGATFSPMEINLSAAFLKRVCAFVKPESKLFPLTIEPHLPKRVVFHAGKTVVDSEEGCVIEGNYPNWRTIVPAGEKTPVSQIALSAVLLADYEKAAKALNPDAMGLRFNIFSEDGAIECKIDQAPNFYSIIMPLKPSTDEQWQPEFLALKTCATT